MAPTTPPFINPSLRTNRGDDGAAGALARSVLQEPRSNQGPKVLLLDFLLTYYLRTTNLMFLVEVKGN